MWRGEGGLTKRGRGRGGITEGGGGSPPYPQDQTAEGEEAKGEGRVATSCILTFNGSSIKCP